jgi:hypothetical protein
LKKCLSEKFFCNSVAAAASSSREAAGVTKEKVRLCRNLAQVAAAFVVENVVEHFFAGVARWYICIPKRPICVYF